MYTTYAAGQTEDIMFYYTYIIILLNYFNEAINSWKSHSTKSGADMQEARNCGPACITTPALAWRDYGKEMQEASNCGPACITTPAHDWRE